MSAPRIPDRYRPARGRLAQGPDGSRYHVQLPASLPASVRELVNAVAIDAWYDGYECHMWEGREHRPEWPDAMSWSPPEEKPRRAIRVQARGGS